MHSIIAFVLYMVSILQSLISNITRDASVFSRIGFTWPINAQRRLMVVSADLAQLLPVRLSSIYLCLKLCFYSELFTGPPDP